MVRYKYSGYERKKAKIGLLMLLPWAIGTVFFFWRPVFESIAYSFSQYNIGDTGYYLEFKGLEFYNYILFEDANYVRNIFSALKSMALQVPIILTFSLFVAILLNQKFIGRTIARSVFFLPVIMGSGVVLSIMNGDIFANTVFQTSSVSSMMFQSTTFQNYMLESGISTELISMISGIVNDVFNLVWKSGIQILIFLMALQGISDSLYEVAKIEGATSWECFWKVTFPMISPMLIVNLIYCVVDSFVDYSNPVMFQINENVQLMDVSVASSMSWLYFIVVIIIIGIVYALVNKLVFYQV